MQLLFYSFSIIRRCCLFHRFCLFYLIEALLQSPAFLARSAEVRDGARPVVDGLRVDGKNKPLATVATDETVILTDALNSLRRY